MPRRRYYYDMTEKTKWNDKMNFFSLNRFVCLFFSFLFSLSDLVTNWTLNRYLKKNSRSSAVVHCPFIFPHFIMTNIIYATLLCRAYEIKLNHLTLYSDAGVLNCLSRLMMKRTKSHSHSHSRDFFSSRTHTHTHAHIYNTWQRQTHYTMNTETRRETSLRIFHLMQLTFSARINLTSVGLFAVYFENKFLIAFCFFFLFSIFLFSLLYCVFALVRFHRRSLFYDDMGLKYFHLRKFFL